MRPHDEVIDNKIAEIANSILEFALSIKPDIGFGSDELSYSVALVLARVQPDYQYANEILLESYEVIDTIIKP